MSEPTLLSGAALRRRLESAVTLREARIAACLTHAELAERASVSIRTVRNAEHGTWTPRLPTRAKLARALGVQPSALRWGPSDPEPPTAA
jgi:transcriptional regulator with XRE-family HTH domain